MISIAAAANVEIPCFLALTELGYQITRELHDENETWIAVRSEERFIANTLCALLALSKLVEMKGKNWQASDQEIDRFLNIFAVPSPAGHAELLKAREQQIQEGGSSFIDWTEAKAKIRHRGQRPADLHGF